MEKFDWNRFFERLFLITLMLVFLGSIAFMTFLVFGSSHKGEKFTHIKYSIPITQIKDEWLIVTEIDHEKYFTVQEVHEDKALINYYPIKETFLQESDGIEPQILVEYDWDNWYSQDYANKSDVWMRAVSNFSRTIILPKGYRINNL